MFKSKCSLVVGNYEVIVFYKLYELWRMFCVSVSMRKIFKC